MDREAPTLDRIFGASMVNRNFIPVGFAMAVFEDECISLHAYFGKFLRMFPVPILREMRKFLDVLRGQGHEKVYAVADERIDGSETLLIGLGATKTEALGDFGPVYELDLRKAKI